MISTLNLQIPTQRSLSTQVKTLPANAPHKARKTSSYRTYQTCMGSTDPASGPRSSSIRKIFISSTKGSFQKYSSLNTKTPFPDRALSKNMPFYPNDIPIERFMKSGHFPLYWKVVQTMQKKSKIPLLHGQPQNFRISYEALKALDFQNGELIRVPTPAFFEEWKTRKIELLHELETNQKYRIVYSILHNIPFRFLFKAGKPDRTSKFSPYLLSATIGIDGSYLESALSFVFGGPAHKYDLDFQGNRSLFRAEALVECVNTMISQGMELKGFPQEKIDEMLSSLADFHQRADDLDTGQLLVIGVPVNQLDSWAYPSKSFGNKDHKSSFPEILNTLSLGKRPANTQVRLCLTEESLGSNGIELVNLMDTESAESYCEGTELPPLEEEETLQKHLEIICSKPEKTLPITTFARDLRSTIKKVLSN